MRILIKTLKELNELLGIQILLTVLRCHAFGSEYGIRYFLF